MVHFIPSPRNVNVNNNQLYEGKFVAIASYDVSGKWVSAALLAGTFIAKRAHFALYFVTVYRFTIWPASICFSKGMLNDMVLRLISGALSKTQGRYIYLVL